MAQAGQLNIRDIIKKEYKKCALDPAYFMRKFCIIQHPIRGKVAFNLYDFQQETLNAFIDNRYNIVLKARQIGLSTLVAGYALWMMLFNSDQNVLVIATKQDTAKNFLYGCVVIVRKTTNYRWHSQTVLKLRLSQAARTQDVLRHCLC